MVRSRFAVLCLAAAVAVAGCGTEDPPTDAQADGSGAEETDSSEPTDSTAVEYVGVAPDEVDVDAEALARIRASGGPDCSSDENPVSFVVRADGVENAPSVFVQHGDVSSPLSGSSAGIATERRLQAGTAGAAATGAVG